jgi:hypothetical protein
VAFHNELRTYEWAPPSAHVVAPLALEHTIFGPAFSFLADAVAGTGMVAKLTIPSLSMVHYRGGRSVIDETVYPTWTSSGPTWRLLDQGRGKNRCAHCPGVVRRGGGHAAERAARHWLRAGHPLPGGAVPVQDHGPGWCRIRIADCPRVAGRGCRDAKELALIANGIAVTAGPAEPPADAATARPELVPC